MGTKRRNTEQLNWQSTTPAPWKPNQALSGTLTGTMSSTNVIYSNIIDLSNMDNIGLEITWTGTPTGTLAIMASDSGVNFFAVTPSPALSQPAGSASGELTGFNQFQHRYIYVMYTNTSGSGVLTVMMTQRDLN